jgi:glyceraldehyde-3-phosphate dehydrogenase/erythrose-4-phosphate dehydrogenase
MAVRVAINGFGRVGPATLRAGFASEVDIDWVATSSGRRATLSCSGRDSVCGRFREVVPWLVELRR